MNFNDFFKHFFGFDKRDKRTTPPGTFFEDEDDIIDGDQHDERDVILHFDMFDIQRQMESMTREMEDMFKNFGGVEFFPAIQQPESRAPQNPRDQMLKDEDQKDSKPSFIQPHQPNWTPFSGPFSPRVPMIEKKEDSDVDGKLEVDDVAKLFDRPASRPQPKMRVESVIESRFGGPDGRMEHKKTVRNADGSSEVTVTRSKGDQSHTVVIKKDNTGTEEKIENFKNIDKGDIGNFNKSWNIPQQPSLPSSRPDQLLRDNDPVIRDDTDASLFNQFFGNWFKPKP